MAHLKKLARELFFESLSALDPAKAVRNSVSHEGAILVTRSTKNDVQKRAAADTVINLQLYDRIQIFSLGKAALAMVHGLMDVLGPDLPVAGIVVAPRANAAEKNHENGLGCIDELAAGSQPLALQHGGSAALPAGMRLILSGHPVPDENSMIAARLILTELARCDASTLIFFLLSGGASALVELPLDPQIGLADLQTFNRLLVNCGASIQEINAVRKHLSAVKGGRLAAAAPRP